MALPQHACATQKASSEEEFIEKGTAYLKSKIQSGLLNKRKFVIGFSGVMITKFLYAFITKVYLLYIILNNMLFKRIYMH